MPHYIGRWQHFNVETRERGYDSQKPFTVGTHAAHPEQCGLKFLDQRIMIIITTMIATMTAAMMKSIKGLFTMCRSMPNLAPSSTKSMPHFGHFPEFG